MFINPDSAPGAEREVAELRAAGINATTTLPDISQPPLADPLEISCDFEEEGYDDTEEGRLEREMNEEEIGHYLILGTDDQIKAGIYGCSDPYSIEVPNPGVDATFRDWHETSFVHYLRIAFRWGGFPGWERYPERPEKELAYLRDGLLPF
jgi:hypothetical protein